MDVRVTESNGGQLSQQPTTPKLAEHYREQSLFICWPHASCDLLRTPEELRVPVTRGLGGENEGRMPKRETVRRRQVDSSGQRAAGASVRTRKHGEGLVKNR